MSWCHKSLATRMFVQQLVQANSKQNIKATHYWTICEGITPAISHRASNVKRECHWGFPTQRTSNAGSFPCHDIIILLYDTVSGITQGNLVSPMALIINLFCERSSVLTNGRLSMPHSLRQIGWLRVGVTHPIFSLIL